MSAVGKEMGACAGKSRKHPVTPTSTGDNPRASADNSSVRDGNALIHARKIYLEQESHMNRKVKDCFEAVFSKTSDSITDLNLKFVNLGAEGMASLASILPLFPNLVNLRLWKTRIGIDGSGYLGRALLRMPQVRLLSLEDNDIRAAGLAKLMDGFRSLVDLEELFIHTNKLGPEGGLLLASLT